MSKAVVATTTTATSVIPTTSTISQSYQSQAVGAIDCVYNHYIDVNAVEVPTPSSFDAALQECADWCRRKFWSISSLARKNFIDLSLTRALKL